MSAWERLRPDGQRAVRMLAFKLADGWAMGRDQESREKLVWLVETAAPGVALDLLEHVLDVGVGLWRSLEIKINFYGEDAAQNWLSGGLSSFEAQDLERLRQSAEDKGLDQGLRAALGAVPEVLDIAMRAEEDDSPAEEPQTLHPEVPEMGEREAILTIQNHWHAGEVHALPKDRALTVGNRRDADIPLRDPWIGWNHARIHFSQGSYWIEDLKSANGLSVDSERVGGPIPLRDGAQIHFGRTTGRFELRLPSALQQPVAAPVPLTADRGSTHADPPPSIPAPQPSARGATPEAHPRPAAPPSNREDLAHIFADAMRIHAAPRTAEEARLLAAPEAVGAAAIQRLQENQRPVWAEAVQRSQPGGPVLMARRASVEVPAGDLDLPDGRRVLLPPFLAESRPRRGHRGPLEAKLSEKGWSLPTFEQYLMLLDKRSGMFITPSKGGEWLRPRRRRGRHVYGAAILLGSEPEMVWLPVHLPGTVMYGRGVVDLCRR